VSNQTLFYICGIALAVSAVLTSLIGLKAKDFPGRAFPLVILWFAILVGSATTFAVLHAKDEEKAKASELEQAGKKFESQGLNGTSEGREAPLEKAEQAEEAGGEGQGGGKPKKATGGTAQGPGGTLQLAADPTEIAFDKTSLASRPGKVTIEFTNPATLEHNIAIEKDGKPLAQSPTIAQGKTSASAELAPGTYTFLCTVPGHAEAGMEGTLVVR
jgi:plastocyanin